MSPTKILHALLCTTCLFGCGGGGGAGGSSGSGTTSNTLNNGNLPPSAAFSAPSNAVRANKPISFDASASRDPDGSIASYAWNFGDGSQGNGSITNHSYGAPGTYDVDLTVRDNAGAAATSRQIISVSNINVVPVAAFSASTNTGTAPLSVNFDASASTDSDGQITSYTWNFDDSSSGVGTTISHTFLSGTFNVLLTVTDNDGVTHSIAHSITVSPGATVSGAISILSSSAVDSDVNDTNAVRNSNDTIATAQIVTNPVSIGGYVNQPNAGPAGVSSSSGDVNDFYVIALSGNETVQLSIGDASTSNLDLYVYNNSTSHGLVARSAGNAATEVAKITQPGTYFVEVRAAAGASNYVLTIGQSGGVAAGVEAGAEFVPGELIVDAIDSSGANRATVLSHLATLGLHPMSAASNSGPMLMKLDPGATLSALGVTARTFPANMSAANMSASNSSAPNTSEKARAMQATVLAAKYLRNQIGVRAVDLNYIRRATATPNDPLYRLQWHLRDISLPQAWDITTGPNNGAADVVVAVIDTGVRLDHPDLAGQLINGFDFISDPTRAHDGDGIDADPNDPGDQALSGTSSFHGTHVTGTIVAASNNGVGVSGICWRCKVMPLRVLGVGGGTSFDLIAAIRYAAGLTNSTGQLATKRADIINISLGGGGLSQNEQNTITQARDAGVIIVAAAGNNSSALPSYPASYAGVVSVSATTITRALAPYSNFGGHIDVAAPGGNNGTDINGDGVGDGVISTHADDSAAGSAISLGYSGLNGTSMASPHVAGVVALMKSVLPTLTPDQLDAELNSGALSDDLGLPGRDDQFGIGLINANKAVARARAIASGSSSGVPATLLTSPGSLSFGPLSSTLNLNVQNAGSAALQIISITSDQPWLSVVATANVGTSGLGTYSVSVNRSGLADGSYAGTLHIQSSASVEFGKEVIVPIVAEKRTASPTSNAGLHYVLLVDPTTNRTVKFQRVNAVNGQYPFNFTDVAPGAYDLVAGSDSNNNGFICEAGEACGTYRTIDSPEQIIVKDSLTGLDFASGYRANINAAIGHSASPSPARAVTTLSKRAVP